VRDRRTSFLGLYAYALPLGSMGRLLGDSRGFCLNTDTKLYRYLRGLGPIRSNQRRERGNESAETGCLYILNFNTKESKQPIFTAGGADLSHLKIVPSTTKGKHYLPSIRRAHQQCNSLGSWITV
jgi:hypothetical protein